MAVADIVRRFRRSGIVMAWTPEEWRAWRAAREARLRELRRCIARIDAELAARGK